MSQWPVRPLSNLIETTTQRDPRKNPDRSFYYIDISSVDSETKTIHVANRIRGSDAPSRARKVVRAGDVIVSTVRPNLNAVAQVPPELDYEVCSTGFSVLRPKREVLDRYLFWFVQSPYFVERLMSMAKGASYPAVTDSDIKRVEISVPPLAEQERIVRFLDEADAVQKLRAKADQRTADLIPALFHQMFGDPVTNSMGWPVKLFVDLLEDGLRNGVSPSKSLRQ